MPDEALFAAAARGDLDIEKEARRMLADPRAREALDELNARWGFTAFKLSPWRIDMHANRWGEVVRASAEYFRQMREAVDPRYEIAFDAHAKIFEPAQARQLGNALAPYDPLFYEEPLRPENIAAWGELKQGLNCRLATGESLYNRFEFLELLRVKGADLIQPDICVVGGITEMRRIAIIAEAHYVPVAPHNPMGPLATAVNVHFAAATQNFSILEYRLPVGPVYVYGGTEVETKEDTSGYVADPYLPKDGYLELRPERPGWGVEMDEDYMQAEGYVHWQRKVPKRPDGSYAFA
jgi:galactonate dehydratase